LSCFVLNAVNNCEVPHCAPPLVPMSYARFGGRVNEVAILARNKRSGFSAIASPKLEASAQLSLRLVTVHSAVSSSSFSAVSARVPSGEVTSQPCPASQSSTASSKQEVSM